MPRRTRGGERLPSLRVLPQTNEEKEKMAIINAETEARKKVESIKRANYEARQKNLPSKGRTQGQRCQRSFAGWDNCKNPLKCMRVWEPYSGPKGSHEDQCMPKYGGGTRRRRSGRRSTRRHYK